jgi:hypothetical protein
MYASLDTRHDLVMINDIVKMTWNMYDRHCKSTHGFTKSEIPIDTARARSHFDIAYSSKDEFDVPDRWLQKVPVPVPVGPIQYILTYLTAYCSVFVCVCVLWTVNCESNVTLRGTECACCELRIEYHEHQTQTQTQRLLASWLGRIYIIYYIIYNYILYQWFRFNLEYSGFYFHPDTLSW